ncbi:hypothetical protein, partial [Pseudomonas baetica]|uniref:hypothetical protein n=1 Tax=Pseudomonas baetica TaxID=674054 RepID=UPI0028724F6C
MWEQLSYPAIRRPPVGIQSNVGAGLLANAVSQALQIDSLLQQKAPHLRNAVHLSGAALRSTGNRVFEIFTVLG